MSFLKLKTIQKSVDGNFTLRNINLTQKRAEKIAIAGETGSGKSTLLKIIAGLVQPDSGQVFFENELVAGPAEKLVPGHPHIAYLSQHFELPKFLRVEQVLSYANALSDEDANIIFEICEINHLLTRNTDQLSGGEKQRIAIARLLIGSPRLLLLDEPYSHLDMVHKRVLKSVIRSIGDVLKITCMLVSHDPDDTLSWADKIVVMKSGEIIQTGTPKDIYYNPVNEYVAGLFGDYNVIEPDSEINLLLNDKARKNVRKNLFLRSECFEVVKKSEAAIKGAVADVRFLGSCFEADVVLNDNVITVRTETDHLEKGQKIYLKLKTKSAWYI